MMSIMWFALLRFSLVLQLQQATLLVFAQLPAAQQGSTPVPVKSTEEQYMGVAAQLVEDECIPSPRQQFVEPLRRFAAGGLLAQEELHLRGPETNLIKWLDVLNDILGNNPYAAFECPLIMTAHIRKAADAALYLGQKSRARVLLQIGNMFKLSAMSRWYTAVSEQYTKEQLPPARQQRFEPRMQMDYQLGLALLTQQLLASPVEPIRKWPAHKPKPKIDVLSICVYSPDETSNTVLDSPLPGMSPENHKQYVKQTGLNRYVMHDKLLMPDREAHYSKFLVVYQHMQQNPDVEWVFFMDCDAFFTNFDFTVFDLLETYAPDEVIAAADGDRPQASQQSTTSTGSKASSPVNFIVAEDTGGINTGVFMVRNTPWSYDYLQRVTMSPFTTAWDQSMFFMSAVNETLFGFSPEDYAAGLMVSTSANGQQLPPQQQNQEGDMSQTFAYLARHDPEKLVALIHQLPEEETQHLRHTSLIERDFGLPPEVVFLHQKHLNAFVPPASKDWGGYEWQPGDFARHFAGCPWQEKPCLDMMYQTMEFGRQQYK
ncbi:unnamed protein product [Amoebophrya sp. A25]|nr:unnamed protein product [Amoebophrya sp. A25]|eukprot:GSA25T00012794001.1